MPENLLLSYFNSPRMMIVRDKEDFKNTDVLEEIGRRLTPAIYRSSISGHKSNTVSIHTAIAQTAGCLIYNINPQYGTSLLNRVKNYFTLSVLMEAVEGACIEIISKYNYNSEEDREIEMIRFKKNVIDCKQRMISSTTGDEHIESTLDAEFRKYVDVCNNIPSYIISLSDIDMIRPMNTKPTEIEEMCIRAMHLSYTLLAGFQGRENPRIMERCKNIYGPGIMGEQPLTSEINLWEYLLMSVGGYVNGTSFDEMIGSAVLKCNIPIHIADEWPQENIIHHIIRLHFKEDETMCFTKALLIQDKEKGMCNLGIDQTQVTDKTKFIVVDVPRGMITNSKIPVNIPVIQDNFAVVSCSGENFADALKTFTGEPKWRTILDENMKFTTVQGNCLEPELKHDCFYARWSKVNNEVQACIKTFNSDEGFRPVCNLTVPIVHILDANDIVDLDFLVNNIDFKIETSVPALTTIPIFLSHSTTIIYKILN